MFYFTLFTNFFGEGTLILKINDALLHNTGSVNKKNPFKYIYSLKEEEN